MTTIRELDCGCEAGVPGAGTAAQPVSYCAVHRLGGPGLYTCGECGFASRRFDRLERHVYRQHLGVQVA